MRLSSPGVRQWGRPAEDSSLRWARVVYAVLEVPSLATNFTPVQWGGLTRRGTGVRGWGPHPTEPMTARTARVTFGRLETPDPPLRVRVSYAAAVIPDYPRAPKLVWQTGLATPAGMHRWGPTGGAFPTDRSVRVTYADLFVPVDVRAARITYAAVEAPTASRSLRLTFAALSVGAIGTARVSFAAVRVPDVPRAVRVTYAVVAVDDYNKHLRLTHAAFAVPSPRFKRAGDGTTAPVYIRRGGL